MINNSLLSQCARSIKRWPRLNAVAFPKLPKGCNFVILGMGGYKLDIHGRIFDNNTVNKEKKRLAREETK